MARLGISLLGPPRITLDGAPVPAFDYAKVLALLVYLAVEQDRAHSRDALAELLWPDQAPQVGRSERLAVIEIEGEKFVLINPEIVEEEGSDKAEEGCLSIPEIYGEVERSTKVVVHAMDRDGQHYEIAADGLLARCLQHEIDHLDGVLFVDHLSALRRNMIMRKLAKEQRAG